MMSNMFVFLSEYDVPFVSRNYSMKIEQDQTDYLPDESERQYYPSSSFPGIFYPRFSLDNPICRKVKGNINQLS